jgi:predicted CoA-binding protein
LLEGRLLNGEHVYASLESIPQDKVGRIDMVDVFRTSAAALEPALEAIRIGARVVWMQLGVINEEGARRAKEAGLTVVMDRCPAIEHPRLFG